MNSVCVTTLSSSYPWNKIALILEDVLQTGLNHFRDYSVFLVRADKRSIVL